MNLLSRSSVALVAGIAFSLAAASIHAQDSKPAAAPAKEAAKPEAKKPAAKQEAKKPAAKQEAKKPGDAKERMSRRQQDARHCLEQPNNTAIIKCAEAYL